MQAVYARKAVFTAPATALESSRLNAQQVLERVKLSRFTWRSKMAASISTTTEGRRQPPWRSPSISAPDAQLPPLTVWNSLTRSKTPFHPINWQKKTVSLYACGVTPYDDAHLGHIRNYTTLDILVRILRDFFEFDVAFVMNVTDVDDKIILRARQRHLLEQFRAGEISIDGHNAPGGIRIVGLEALGTYLRKNLRVTFDQGSLDDLVARIAQIEEEAGQQRVGTAEDGIEQQVKRKMHLRTAVGAIKALRDFDADQRNALDGSSDLDDVLMPYLDSKATIDAGDHSIFTKLARKYEDRFWEDLRSMNCLPVDEITRVTEYVPQIIAFIEKIQANGYAYKTSDGSVYFDIGAFEKDGNKYPRLEPWSRNDAGLQADGEGALTAKTSEKRGQSDFALWKSSKAGEPAWSSPWGQGRPGWHIECSAMASDKLGRQFDIHSGGIDLAFPHHDNELAQSEAYWTDKRPGEQHQWVNYFLHIGHLSIAGAKMSKSLKNFTTIREALGRGEWTPRGLRIIFLLGGWRDGVEIKEGLIKQGSAWEDKLNNFFLKAKGIHQEGSVHDTQNGSIQSDSIEEALEKARAGTFDALCDSFNTAKVMDLISDLISTANASGTRPSAIVAVSRWVTSMVNIFGLNGDAKPDDPAIGWSGLDIPEKSRPLLTTLSDIRDRLRVIARSGSGIDHARVHQVLDGFSFNVFDRFPEAPLESRLVFASFTDTLSSLDKHEDLSKDVLSLCDKLRDVDLWDQNVYLEDREGDRPALIRPVTRELRIAREEKDARDKAKLDAKLKRDREAALKAEKGRLSPLEMYKTSEYSAWDEDGMPRKDAEGEEVTKSKLKKLRKEWERQKKLHDAYVKEQS